VPAGRSGYKHAGKSIGGTGPPAQGSGCIGNEECLAEGGGEKEGVLWKKTTT